jgi:hypothetical protein
MVVHYGHRSTRTGISTGSGTITTVTWIRRPSIGGCGRRSELRRERGGHTSVT